jgi:hypothetical protein
MEKTWTPIILLLFLKKNMDTHYFASFFGSFYKNMEKTWKNMDTHYFASFFGSFYEFAVRYC